MRVTAGSCPYALVFQDFLRKITFGAPTWTGPDRAWAPARKTVLNLRCVEHY
jgi:hypothetical protein